MRSDLLRVCDVYVYSYCEAPVEEIVNPGHAHHMAPGALHRTGSSSSSSSSDDEHGMRNEVPVEHINADGTTSVTPGKPKKKRGLLNKILHH